MVIKKIFSNSGIYVISVIFNKGLNFALLPILTAYLSKKDYGTLSLLMAITTIASVYVGMFPSSFVINKYYSYGKEKIAEYIGNLFILVSITYLVILFVLLLFQNILLPANLDHKAFLLFLVSLYALFSMSFTFIDTILQIEKNAIKFSLLQTFQSVSSVSLALLLIIEFSAGWKGKFYAELAVLSLVFIYTIWYIIKHNYYKASFNISYLKELWFFLFPLTFNVVGLYLMGSIDRIFIGHFLGLKDVGIYAIAIAMAMVINIVYDSIMKAISPFLYELLALQTQESKIQAMKLTYIYLLGCIVIFISYILLLPYVFHIMINEKFNAALTYIPYLALSFTFEGIRKIFSAYLTYYNHVKIIALSTVIAAILNIVLNYFFIQTYGIIGAVISSLICFGLLTIFNIVYVSNKIKIPFLLKQRIG